MKVRKLSDTIYITKRFIRDEEFSELDFEFQDDFSIGENDNYAIIELGHSRLSSSASPIPIDQMIETLQSMKKSGANYVEMDYHEDHYGYEIAGYKITRSNPEEIEIFEQERADEEEDMRNRRRTDLHRQLNELDNE
jgi:hypothetical protein